MKAAAGTAPIPEASLSSITPDNSWLFWDMIGLGLDFFAALKIIGLLGESAHLFKSGKLLKPKLIEEITENAPKVLSKTQADEFIEGISKKLDDPNHVNAIRNTDFSKTHLKNTDKISDAKKVKSKENGNFGGSSLDEVSAAGSVLDDIVLAMKADFPSTWKFNKIGDDAFEVLDGAGQKWGTVYKDKIVCPARTQIGVAGNPILNKAVLVKNMRYEVDGIIYQSDELGRVLTTTADLDDIARVRLRNQQIRAVDVKDGVRGVDQGGHIVGSRFFGPGEQINLYPQSANLNQGAWKTMENSWADAMAAGKDVKIEVEAVFSGASKRPDSFKVKYTIDGEPFQENFINQ